HQKAVSTLLRITSKGHHWIDPGDDIDLTAIPLWVRVGFTPLEIPAVATRNPAGHSPRKRWRSGLFLTG
ncbi:MAG: hypothetical protein QME90_19985, partial [Thermodesulfobacteriota bacterium]|nr:hypothetical protein [Thermodesulfobacteriota bacterium]